MHSSPSETARSCQRFTPLSISPSSATGTEVPSATHRGAFATPNATSFYGHCIAQQNRDRPLLRGEVAGSGKDKRTDLLRNLVLKEASRGGLKRESANSMQT